MLHLSNEWARTNSFLELGNADAKRLRHCKEEVGFRPKEETIGLGKK